jgi:hypothetical protein
MALNLIEKVAAANNPASSQKRKRSESSEEASPSRSSGPSRGCQGSQPIRAPTLLEATEPTALPTATSLTGLGPLREAEATTQGEGRPEAEDTASSEVVVTTAEDSLDEAGGGRGAAGRLLQSAANIEAAPNVVLYLKNS